MARFALLLAASAFWALPAAAQSIEGAWRVDNGETVTFSRCGEAFCSRIDTGRYAGKTVGRMAGGAGGRYEGNVVDPTSDKSYDGHAEVTDRRLVLTGCVAKVFCRSQTWTR